MAGVRAMWDDVRLKEDTIGTWRQSFYASNLCPAQSRIRRNVEALACRAAGGSFGCPLRSGRSWVLQQRGGRGVDSDVGEWRPVHVEARFEVLVWWAAGLCFQDLVADEESLRGDFC